MASKTKVKKQRPAKAHAKKSPDKKRTNQSNGTHKVVVGQPLRYDTAPHPPRVNSPEYNSTRKWLMGKTPGGCFICGGPVDLSHPEAPADSKGLKLEDHHGGGLYHNSVLIGFNLFPLEWATGWGAAPKKVAEFVDQLNATGIFPKYPDPINTVADVMKWVDSQFNANVKLCHPHHVGLQTQHTPDVNGHEAVGIHNAPWPVLAAQATCDWDNFNMFAGTTGTLAVSPDPTTFGGVFVTYVHDSHPATSEISEIRIEGIPRKIRTARLEVGTRLPADHPSAIAAFAGYKSKALSAESLSVDDYKLSVLLPEHRVRAEMELSARRRL